MRKIALLLCFSAFWLAASAQQLLTNDGIIQMKKAGLSDDLILTTIQAAKAKFDVSPAGLIALKSAGLDDKLMEAIVNKASGLKTAVASANAAAANASVSGSSLPPGIDEVGVYYQNSSGAWTEMMPEVINYKSGGFLKSLATDGIIKGDMNGHIPGKQSKFVTTFPVHIALYVPEGTAPTEYLLLRLRVNSNNREFRSMTGGVIHSSGGATRDEVPFTATKIAPRVYTFTLDQKLGKGEYGIMPPGSVTTSNLASSGKIYSMSITE